MNYAHLNAAGDVLAKATVVRTLAQAQIKNPAVTEIIVGSPADLKSKTSDCSHSDYHQKSSGDGTDILHYTLLLDNPSALAARRIERAAEIDAKTATLLAGGFIHAAKTFSLSVFAQLNMLDMMTFTDWDYISSPPDLRMPTIDDLGFYDIVDEADKVQFCASARDRVLTVRKGGVSLKKQVIDAATQTAIDLVVDTRI